MDKIISSCTTILAGKKATIDGSTLVARTEDHSDDAEPQKFIVVEPKDQPKHYSSKLSKFEIDLPDKPLRYTATPDSDNSHGIWAGAGINSENVAMSATETITTNSRILAVDPLVKDGFGEEDMPTLVLPYIHSAREGVQRMGDLLTQYGTYESNGMAFSDKNEVWYLETYGGHHWAAIRIPDDAYVVAPNRLNIDNFDFGSPDAMYSEDLEQLINDNFMNPDDEGYNFRHIFGSATIKDTRYNDPRAWYIQSYFTPSVEQDPQDQDLPFICHADRKLAIEDFKWAMSSHYQNTVFDRYGEGELEDKTLFRPVGINRNEESHILQIRNNVPEEVAAIHWLGFGPNTFNSFVPFLINITDTPASFKDATAEYDPNTAYWLSRTLGTFGDTNYSLYSDLESDFEQTTQAQCRAIINRVTKEAKDAQDIDDLSTKANQEMADIYIKESKKLLGKMVTVGSARMKLKFSLLD
ncbi:C69 family dipeptidase [Ligilactobacillus acidipiscis]|uniref:Dipeptidase n=1 Tax=Ligilactobacillus acidipiscis TaxID=89059 RepID=A0A0R2K0S3_9LACO|nr:C69 family dipeptidase [Ligilactobacillus acidipiscis]KRN79805.1 dipeptidase A [Ligilactobacillus acidipiscis]